MLCVDWREHTYTKRWIHNRLQHSVCVQLCTHIQFHFLQTYVYFYAVPLTIFPSLSHFPIDMLCEASPAYIIERETERDFKNNNLKSRGHVEEMDTTGGERE